MEKGEIRINTENIFPIIKKAVYSDHEIFLRELVSNAVDAISKRRMASMAGDCENSDKPQVKITIDREKSILKISDNGIGMNDDEIKKYINQVAFSSAEEFLTKYKQGNDEFIGHFGLGFYSSFMVADRVDILTKSAISDSKAFNWSCDGSPNFTLEESERDSVGTDVILHLMDEEKEFIEPERIKSLIKKYCDFMPIDVLLEGEIINKKNPPWRKQPNELKDEDYIELYKYLYPFQGDPLLWIHLNTDYPYDIQGILYFPKLTGRADWEKGEIKLFCNQVFVSDSIKEIVPKYLLPLRGVIDSTDIPLNVSRSALQTDRKVRSISSFISKKIANKLKDLLKNSPEFYTQIWDSISAFIKIGAIEDEKFADLVENSIIFETIINSDKDITKYIDDKSLIKSNDKFYTTLSNYKDRNNITDSKKIIYCSDVIGQSSALNICLSDNKEVIKSDPLIDAQFLPWIESKHDNYQFQRVDSEINELEDKDSKEIVDKDGKSSTDNLKDIISKALNNEKVTVKIQSLTNKDAPPAMILLPEQMRRINDMGAYMEQKMPSLPEYHVLLINKEHPLILGLSNMTGSKLILDKKDPGENPLASKIANHVYDMAKLSVGGLDQEQIINLQNNNADLISDLLKSST
ncbi:heat shock protein HtpG [Prochlorococcus marinus str. MIT 9515]|uniref:Heat shock protein HtpG n=1 Tax=Prochlorococcus marinus (strain MIT 9515) TaxID=167542 RepID=A2BWM9_PROM5|nr:molecular chaperone HtpG [Prochlorococcus marinus]ABM72190.1 heat shock protein HtpG [Prochlorococcus marinus str. MIT 9515]